jgi:alcohol dehydrogenase
MSDLPFDFAMSTRIVFGVDSLDRLGRFARELGATRVLVSSDRGVIEAGHTARGIAALEAAGMTATCFDKVHENPSTDDVAAGLELAQQFEPDLLVGLGGGSSMDCAKGINFLYTNGGQMKDYWGVGKAQQPMLPMIAVPTTAGTGSEAQSFALISDAQTHAKMACGDKKAACKIALLDPRLTLTQPARVTALTGIDAMAHALETLVTNRWTPISRLFSREAFRLLATNFPRVLDDPQDLEARGGMQLGACLAGLAIENSMLGAAHGLANPLTAHYGIIHGQAVGLMLPHVIRFNAPQADGAYHLLLQNGARHSTGDATGNHLPSVEQGEEGLADFVTQLAERAGLATKLAQVGVERSMLPKLAADAAKQWTTSFNPRPADADALLELYHQAF